MTAPGRLRALALAGILGLPLVEGSAEKTGDILKHEGSLKKIQAEISRKTGEKEKASREEREVSREVDRISRELNNARGSLDDVERRLSAAESKRRETEERLWASQLGLNQWGDLLSRELNIFYERKMTREASAFLELAYRRAALADKNSGLAFAREHHAQIAGVRDELLGAEVELQKLRQLKATEEARVETARREMQVFYNTVRGRRAVLEKEIQDLQTAAQNLQTLVQNLIEEQRKREAEQAARAARAAPAHKAPRPVAAAPRHPGKLPWPAEGEILERFGRSRHAELDTYVFSNGIKLRPASAAPVRSVEKGEVVFAGEFMGYGLMALVSHPGGMHTVYAHLASLAVKRGQKVSVGEVLGSSGRDAAGRPLLYFEIRLGGVAVDPLVWLK